MTDKPRRKGFKIARAARATTPAPRKGGGTLAFVVSNAGRCKELPHDELVATFEAYAQAKKSGAARETKMLRDRISTHNLRLVISIAKTFHRPGPREVPLEDLISEGVIGLMKSIDRFDHTRGFRFSTYATWWIRQAVADAAAVKKRTIRVPNHASRLLRKLLEAIEDYKAAFGTEPSYDELAEVTGASHDVVRATLQTGGAVISADTTYDGSDGAIPATILTRYPDPAPGPFEILAEAEMMGLVRQALAELTPREAVVLRLRHGMLGDVVADPAPYEISDDEAARVEAGEPLT